MESDTHVGFIKAGSVGVRVKGTDKVWFAKEDFFELPEGVKPVCSFGNFTDCGATIKFYKPITMEIEFPEDEESTERGALDRYDSVGKVISRGDTITEA
ncbi:unnamed protein product [marine sediment metagenome]|uniref:Uncharacterized protein n=1 Tax=marine sediment metagenome TaxID=412755 RepID=X0W867_9ZZZZ